MSQKEMLSMIKQTLQVMMEPGQVVELRVADVSTSDYWAPHTVSGYFNDFDALAKAALEVNPYAPAIYFTLNPVNPDLLSRAANRTRT